MQYQLNISGLHFEYLQKHLYPGDGKEAIAIALCGRLVKEDLHRLLIHDLVLIPHDECERHSDYVNWKTDRLIPVLERALKNNMAILKIHSHPGGYDDFSRVDDKSDRELFSSVFGWTDSLMPHGSAVMLPTGKIFGRLFFEDLSVKKIDQVLVAGDTIFVWGSSNKDLDLEIGKRVAQAFGEGTYGFLKKLKIGIIGCSGTGSPVIEQLVRLGIGEIVLVDPDLVELKNLNRILNSKKDDVDKMRLKVDVIKEAILAMGLGTKVKVYADNLYDNVECLNDLASCDLLFGCVDSVDGRDILNRLSSYYLLPYFDLGIKLEADGKGGISKIVGTVNYLQPGKSSLMSRGFYDAEDLKAAGLFRIDPEGFPDLVKNSYIKNINVNRPAVISVNMMIASYAVNEFLNRIHPYKSDNPIEYAQSTIDLTEGCFIHLSEKDLKADNFLLAKTGLGDRKIFLDMVELAKTSYAI
jgi:hypothetical protein